MAKSYVQLYRLVELFHFLENGTLLIPAFQRRYVWRKPMVKNLFTSINRGYPIGMLIVAEGDSSRFSHAPESNSLLPEPPEGAADNERRLWVLDGSQRLAALYNVLGKGESPFDLLYDLEHREFLFPREARAGAIAVRMASIFRVRELMQFHSELAAKGVPDVIHDELNSLHERMKDYHLPLQVIADVDNEELVEIFSYLNTAGVHLTKAELVRAMEFGRAT